ncbi:MAG: hypothetical protein GY755_16155 [Chloroflexi bacterium]|nr:hypothetical protein [Chloroflexota bacterium]
MNSTNIGKVVYDDFVLGPCTSQAAVKLLDATGLEMKGLDVVVVGYSEIVGKPNSKRMGNIWKYGVYGYTAPANFELVRGSSKLWIIRATFPVSCAIVVDTVDSIVFMTKN